MFRSSSQDGIATDGLPKNQYFVGKLRFHDGGLFEFCEILNKTLNDAVNNRESMILYLLTMKFNNDKIIIQINCLYKYIYI